MLKSITYESPESNESNFVENGASLKIGDFVKVILNPYAGMYAIIHMVMRSKFSILKLGSGS